MTFKVGGQTIGDGAPCFVIAEAGVNHNGDLDRALEMVDVAARAGADCVKFQTFSADRLTTADAPQADYQTRNTGVTESQHAMLARLELDADAHAALKARADKCGIVFLSSPFDEASADLLERVGAAAYKLGSGELTNTPLIKHVAKKGSPLIVSTGMADLAEVRRAVAAVREAGAPPLALLHCVSDYPSEPQHANLRAMATMRDAFGVPVGFSDHTLGLEVPWAAVALGACILEKHFTLDRSLAGPDHKASLIPDELERLVAGVRRIESALGSGEKRPWPHELAVAAVARKSVVAARDLASGTRLGPGDLIAKRPGTGIPPFRIDELVGRTTKRALRRDAMIQEDDLE